MTAYEWSREHNAFTKTCPKCKRLYIGGENDETTRTILYAYFHHKKEKLDGYCDYCRFCSADLINGRLDSPNPVKMLESQNGKCAICYEDIFLKSPKDPSRKQTAYVDHNQKTGRTRALLCNSCNVKVSYAEKDWEIELRYLAYWKKKHDGED